jgi:hypothetical protein
LRWICRRIRCIRCSGAESLRFTLRPKENQAIERQVSWRSFHILQGEIVSSRCNDQFDTTTGTLIFGKPAVPAFCSKAIAWLIGKKRIIGSK